MKHKTMPQYTKIASRLKSGRVKGAGGIIPSRGRKQSLSRLKKKCWTAFSKYIRLRDCLQTTGCASFGLCITCGKRYHIKLLQAGHFISGRHNANLFLEEGCHAQCYNCNINLRGNTLEYRRQIVAKYGTNADVRLEQAARGVKKFTIQELTDMIKYYDSKCKL